MAETPFITQVTLPTGTTYDLRDQGARDLIAGGIQYIIAWSGSAAPVAANIPAGVVVTYNGANTTGTLAASASTVSKFYLVKSATQKGTADVYDEYITVLNGTDYSWEKLGDTQANYGTLAEKNSVALDKKTATVLGTGTTFSVDKPTVSFGNPTKKTVLLSSATFTAGSSSVSFGAHTKDKVLGVDTTFGMTQPTINVTPATTNIKATLGTNVAVGANGTASVVTGYTPTTSSFATGVSATKKKLTTTSITPTNGTQSVSKVTKTASKLATTTVTGVSGSVTTHDTPTLNTTSVGSASGWSAGTLPTMTVKDHVLTFSAGTLPSLIVTSKTVGESLTAGSEVTVPKAATSATTVATGATSDTGSGTAIVTGVSITDYTVAKAGTAVTVATGALSDIDATSNVGETIAIDAAASGSADAVTDLGTPSTASALTGVKVTTQPTINLSTGATAGTGVVGVATGISSATATGGAVTVGTDDQVDAITALGEGTAAAQTITVDGTDKTADVISALGTATIGAQTVTVNKDEKTVLLSTTGVTVS